MNPHNPIRSPAYSTVRHSRRTGGWLEVRLVYGMVTLIFFGLSFAIVMIIRGNKSAEPLPAPTRAELEEYRLRDQRLDQEQRRQGERLASVIQMLENVSLRLAQSNIQEEQPLVTLYRWRLNYPWPQNIAALIRSNYLPSRYQRGGAEHDLLQELAASQSMRIFNTGNNQLRIRVYAKAGEAAKARQQLSAAGKTASIRLIDNRSAIELTVPPSETMSRLRLEPVMALWQKRVDEILAQARAIHPLLGSRNDPEEVVINNPPASKVAHDRRLAKLKELNSDYEESDLNWENLLSEFSALHPDPLRREWQQKLADTSRPFHRLGSQLAALLEAPYVIPKPPEKKEEDRSFLAAPAAPPPPAPPSR